jgi:hypothetical protein
VTRARKKPLVERFVQIVKANLQMLCFVERHFGSARTGPGGTGAPEESPLASQDCWRIVPLPDSLTAVATSGVLSAPTANATLDF